MEESWLTEPEQQAWRRLMALLTTLPAALDAQLQRDAGLTHYDYVVLAMLSEAPGRTLRMSELARLTSGSLSRLSHVVAKLERRAWVRRAPCPGDGRATIATLTDAGWAMLAAAAPGHVATVRALVFDGTTDDDVRRLDAVAAAVLARVEPDHPLAPVRTRPATD